MVHGALWTEPKVVSTDMSSRDDDLARARTRYEDVVRLPWTVLMDNATAKDRVHLFCGNMWCQLQQTQQSSIGKNLEREASDQRDIIRKNSKGLLLHCSFIAFDFLCNLSDVMIAPSILDDYSPVDHAISVELVRIGEGRIPLSSVY
ncbi:hypothetical protein KC320_g75 [Hortaea werneckii]|nr:hypothetical protein KC320_g75 [Hortaea werneckii]